MLFLRLLGSTRDMKYSDGFIWMAHLGRPIPTGSRTHTRRSPLTIAGASAMLTRFKTSKLWAAGPAPHDHKIAAVAHRVNDQPTWL